MSKIFHGQIWLVTRTCRPVGVYWKARCPCFQTVSHHSRSSAMIVYSSRQYYACWHISRFAEANFEVLISNVEETRCWSQIVQRWEFLDLQAWTSLLETGVNITALARRFSRTILWSLSKIPRMLLPSNAVMKYLKQRSSSEVITLFQCYVFLSNWGQHHWKVLVGLVFSISHLFSTQNRQRTALLCDQKGVSPLGLKRHGQGLV